MDKEFIPQNLPPKQDIETKKILKKAIEANKALAKLNGCYKIIPNSNILISSLSLQEAQSSSAIENIITTQDELYKATIDISHMTQEAKEVQHYRKALLMGYDFVKKNGLLLKKDIVNIQEQLEQNKAGVRRQSGTKLINPSTKEIILVPPQSFETIEDLLKNLEQYINEPNKIDALINMAIIHYQFESIHPFYDGNGRTGRIINILYLVLKNLLDIPILYLSDYIIKNKQNYYKLLQEVRTKNSWEDWILYILSAVETTSLQTISFINGVNDIMEATKKNIKNNAPKIYSKDLLELLFENPYITINIIVNSLKISRQTASKYIEKLIELDILSINLILKKKKYYINKKLFERLKQGLS